MFPIHQSSLDCRYLSRSPLKSQSLDSNYFYPHLVMTYNFLLTITLLNKMDTLKIWFQCLSYVHQIQLRVTEALTMNKWRLIDIRKYESVWFDFAKKSLWKVKKLLNNYSQFNIFWLKVLSKLFSFGQYKIQSGALATEKHFQIFVFVNYAL